MEFTSIEMFTTDGRTEERTDVRKQLKIDGQTDGQRVITKMLQTGAYKYAIGQSMYEVGEIPGQYNYERFPKCSK